MGNNASSTSKDCYMPTSLLSIMRIVQCNQTLRNQLIIEPSKRNQLIITFAIWKYWSGILYIVVEVLFRFVNNDMRNTVHELSIKSYGTTVILREVCII